MDLYRSNIEDLRVRTSSVVARSARPPHSYRVRHRRLESCGPRAAGATRLCQAPDTRMWLIVNARKVEDETSSVFSRKAKHPERWKGIECLAFQRTIPNLLNPTTRPSGPLDRPDLESRSATLDRSRVRSRREKKKNTVRCAARAGVSRSTPASPSRRHVRTECVGTLHD